MAWGRRRVGFRGGALLFFGLTDGAIALGLSYLPQEFTERPFYSMLAQVWPLRWWALAWTAASALCLVMAFRRRDVAAFSASAALFGLWSALSVVDWILNTTPRAWLAAALYGALAAFITLCSFWDEPLEPVVLALPLPLPPGDEGGP